MIHELPLMHVLNQRMKDNTYSTSHVLNRLTLAVLNSIYYKHKIFESLQLLSTFCIYTVNHVGK